MNARSALLLALGVGFAFSTTGCLHRRRVIVVHEAYPPPVMVQPTLAPPQSPPPVTAPKAPPAAQVETQPPAPSPAHVWVEGYWAWERRWVWRPGLWVARPRPGAVWSAGHWHRAPRGWVWTPGRWH